MSQGHDKEFKFSPDNYSEGEQRIVNAGALKSLSGPREGNVIKKKKKKKSGKVDRVRKEKNLLPDFPFPHPRAFSHNCEMGTRSKRKPKG